MRGEEKPYDMQAPSDDSELTKAIENDREMEETSIASLLASPILDFSHLKSTIVPSTASISPAETSTGTKNDITSLIPTSSKALIEALPDSPTVSFPSISSLLSCDGMDIKDPICETNNDNNQPVKNKHDLVKPFPPTISLPTSPLPLSKTTISLPTQPLNLYNAKIPTSSPQIFSSLTNQSSPPLFFAVDVSGEKQPIISKAAEISKSYASVQNTISSVFSNNQLGCSISIGSVDSSTTSLSPCPSSSGSSSSPHSYTNQSINGPNSSPELRLSSAEGLSISPASLHISSSMISAHLPHSLDSLLTPAASPEDDSLEPWIQTV